jgi:hypothetical protein
MNHAESNVVEVDSPEQYLSPEQRLDLVADLLATIALRVLKNRHAQNQSQQSEQ